MGRESTVWIPNIGSCVFDIPADEGHRSVAVLSRGEQWSPLRSLVFREVMDRGVRVCEIGSDFGWFAVQAASLGATVLVVEPDARWRDITESNLRHNGILDATVRAAPVGVADGDWDVLRIGAEEALVPLLRDAPTVFQRARAIVLSCCAAAMVSAGGGVADLIEAIGANGGRVFEVDETAWRLWELTLDQLTERLAQGRFSVEGGEQLELVVLRDGDASRLAHLADSWPAGRALADTLHPFERSRVELTVSCADCEGVPKIPLAGRSVEVDGVRLQLMHNGVRIVEGCYYGSWTTEIITRLRGHHEPQEELVFHHILERIARDRASGHAPTMVELGSFWAFYSLWFLHEFPDARVALLEPDDRNLEVGAVNLRLNDRSAVSFLAAVGATADPAPFECDDGRIVEVPRMTLADVQRAADIPHADLVLADIQGAETELLELALSHLSASVRFLVVSTHPGVGPGGVDRHDHCLAMLRSTGAHVIVEHTIAESFSGDGLIAVSFDPADRDLVIDVSRSRARESALFDTSKEEWRAHARNLEASLDAAREYTTSLEQARLRAEEYAQALEAEREAREST